MAKKLSSQEIREQTFTAVRLREGYAIDEVNSFLNEVERTVRSHEKEVADLKALKGSDDDGQTAKRISQLEKKNKELEGFKKWVEDNTAKMGGSLKAFVSDDSDDSAAEEIRSYQQKIAELESALEEMSEEMRTRDRRKAARIVDLAQENAAKVLDDAEKHAEQIKKEALDQIQQEISHLEAHKRELIDAVSHLSNLESENRDRLTAFYQNSLEEIQSKNITQSLPLDYVVGGRDFEEKHQGNESPTEEETFESNDKDVENDAIEDVTINDYMPTSEDVDDSDSQENKSNNLGSGLSSNNNPPVRQFPSFSVLQEGNEQEEEK